MNALEVGRAVTFICEGRGKPVALWVRRKVNAPGCEVTKLVPCGRTQAVQAGTFTPGNITIAELRADLNAAEAELTKAGRRAA